MRYPIILYNKSCAKFAKKCRKIYKGKKVVVAIGGGTVIDKAKIAALPEPCIAYPTTASGAAFTSHAVVWTKHAKIDIPTPKPIYKKYPYAIKTMPASTYYDAKAHCLDSLHSGKCTPKSIRLAKKALRMLYDNKMNKRMLVEAGNLAGQAIEITGTHLIHKLSYPMTIYLGIPHAQACEKAMDWLWGEYPDMVTAP
jgi:alcohol dehydrogenase class IV